MKYLWALLLLATSASGQVNVLKPVAVIDGAALATNVYGTPIHMMYLDNIAVQFVWTGTPTCTLSVLVSNQTTPGSNPPTPVSGSFTALTIGGLTNPAGSSGSFVIDLNNLGEEWVEAAYTSCTGSGTLSAYLTAKGV